MKFFLISAKITINTDKSYHKKRLNHKQISLLYKKTEK